VSRLSPDVSEVITKAITAANRWFLGKEKKALDFAGLK
jgi:hypothetical protein